MAHTYEREPLTGPEYDKFVNACRTFREKLVIWTLLDTGVRVSEFCNLRREDVLWQENRMIVWGKKAGAFSLRKKRRLVPLTLRVKQLLELYFATNDRICFSVRKVQRLVKKVANRALITKPVSPHILRHTFATNCVKSGLSTASLSKILGHDLLETTEIYLNICPEDALGEFSQKVAGNWYRPPLSRAPLVKREQDHI